MSGRLQEKVAIVSGAGQTPGDTIGNGRATAILFAREGARVVLVDRRLDSAQETEKMIKDEGGESFAFEGASPSRPTFHRRATARRSLVPVSRRTDGSTSSTTTWGSAAETAGRSGSPRRSGIGSSR
jgi:NAD(P)-dependent dehydrogenase (short-subunit alcohol dehydrogenase family)